MVIITDSYDDPARYKTMSLEAIPADRPKRETAPRPVNVTADIDGAQPQFYKTKPFTNKPDLYRNEDIHGSSPKRLHSPIRNKVNYSLRSDDIPGAVCKPMKALPGERHVDPQNPDYPLPSVVVEEPPIPRFIRDSYSVDDIEGAKPKPKRQINLDDYQKEDIPGSHADSHWREVRQPRDALDVSDITGHTFKSKRVTDVLNPVHLINGMIVKDEPQSRPRPSRPPRSSPSSDLRTDDVRGASPSKPRGWSLPNPRTVNDTSDIPGAQADTVKYAFRTKRRVDPVLPTYKGLEGEELPSPVSPRCGVPARTFIPKERENGKEGTDATRPMSTTAAAGRDFLDNFTEDKDATIKRLQADIQRMRKLGASQLRENANPLRPSRAETGPGQERLPPTTSSRRISGERSRTTPRPLTGVGTREVGARMATPSKAQMEEINSVRNLPS